MNKDLRPFESWWKHPDSEESPPPLMGGCISLPGDYRPSPPPIPPSRI